MANRGVADRAGWRNRGLFAACALLACLVAGLGGEIVTRSRRAALGYVHPRRMEPPSAELLVQRGFPHEATTLVAADGVELAAWYTPPRNRTVVLVAHGYGGRRDVEMHALLARYSYGVVSWDFRAHGASGGDLCTLGHHERLDVEAALDFALAQEGVERVGAWGASMGGAAVILAAAERDEIAAVIADSAFAALEDELDTMIRVGFLRPLVRLFAEAEAGVSVDLVRPVDRVGAISPRPLMIVHGLSDDVVGPDAGQRLFEAAGEPRELWSAAGVEHVAMRAAFPEEYERRVVGFFDRALGVVR